MTNEHQQDYGGTCDTCANGVAKLGARQCRVCLERDAEVDAHIDEQAAIALAIKVLEDYQWAQQTQARRERVIGCSSLAAACDAESTALQGVIDELSARVTR